MNRNVIIASVVVIGLIVAGGAAYFMLNEKQDPDYYTNPYYTVQYRASNEVKTLNGLTMAPTGEYTKIYTGAGGFVGYLGTSGEFIWWDVTVEIYAAPDTGFGGSVFLETSKVDSGFYITFGEHSNLSCPVAYVKTDNNGRFTWTFTVGVYSDDEITGVMFTGFGTPRFITFIL